MMKNYKNKFFTLALLAGFVLATGTGCAGFEDMAKNAMKKFSKDEADKIDELFKKLKREYSVDPNVPNPALKDAYTLKEKKRVAASVIDSTDSILGPEANYFDLKESSNWKEDYEKLESSVKNNDEGPAHDIINNFNKKLYKVLTQLRDCEKANEEVAASIQSQLESLIQDAKALKSNEILNAAIAEEGDEPKKEEEKDKETKE